MVMRCVPAVTHPAHRHSLKVSQHLSAYYEKKSLYKPVSKEYCTS